MNRDQEMLNYRKRWQAVSEIERQEALTASIDLRWKQLNRMVGLARSLKIIPNQDENNDEIIKRWVRLKNLR